MTTTLRVADVMTGIVEAAQENETMAEVAERMAESGVGMIPVCDKQGRLQGIVTDRDLVTRGIARGRDPRTTTISEIETGDVKFVSPNDPIEAAAQLMASEQVRRVPVVRGEELVGVIGQSDLARAMRLEHIGAVVVEVLRT